jgi:hypothetical protein
MSQSWGTPYQNVGKNRYGANAIDLRSTYFIPELNRQGQSNSTSAGIDLSSTGSQSQSDSSSGFTEWSTDDNYMYFDSTHRNFTSNLSAGQLIFDINPINLQQPLDNVISMRINSFYFPNITTPDTSPDYFFFGRAYLNVTSSTLPVTQSIKSFNGNNYHFELDITNVNTVAVKMEPLDPIFYFQRPVQSLSQITFNFTTPVDFKPIPIPNDTLSVTSVAPGSNPAVFQINGTDTTDAIGPNGAQTAPGVAVYFANFNSQVNNAAANTIMNSDGYFITNVNSATNTFTVGALDLTALGATTLSGTAIIAKNRIGIEVRFKSFRQQLTNGIVATSV